MSKLKADDKMTDEPSPDGLRSFTSHSCNTLVTYFYLQLLTHSKILSLFHDSPSLNSAGCPPEPSPVWLRASRLIVFTG